MISFIGFVVVINHAIESPKEESWVSGQARLHGAFGHPSGKTHILVHT
jgi:hypothetical protein